MNAYSDLLRRDRRLTILIALSQAPAQGANESQLERVCNELKVWGTRAQIRTELLWLEQQGYVETEELHGLMMATANDEGVAIAKGQMIHTGITVPSPKRRK